MNKERVSLEKAVKFHGHLGPYLVLGILAGELALKKLKCQKYFGLDVSVWGANKKPRSCLIDGLQLSTGATYGKGNIKKLKGTKIKIEFSSRLNHKKNTLMLKDALMQKIKQAKTHKDAELLAKQLYKEDHLTLFRLTTKN